MYSKKFIETLNQIDDFYDYNNGNVWFRGHSSSTYKLNSGLFRLNLKTLEEYKKLEQQFYNYYKNNTTLLNVDYENIELLYSMQHHGVKTRLLDWTKSLGVALFFILNSWSKGTARLWLLNPIELNKLSIGNKAIFSPSNMSFEKINTLTSSIAIYPIKNSKRIIAQHGFFTIQSNCLNPLDMEFNSELTNNNNLKYIDLNIEQKEDIIKFVAQNNINDFSMFPDLDGLAKHLNNKLIKQCWL